MAEIDGAHGLSITKQAKALVIGGAPLNEGTHPVQTIGATAVRFEQARVGDEGGQIAFDDGADASTAAVNDRDHSAG